LLRQQQEAALLKQQQQAEQLRQQQRQEALRKQQQEIAAQQKALQEQQQAAAALQQRQQQEAAFRQQQQAAAAAQQDANKAAAVAASSIGTPVRSTGSGVAGLDIITGLGGLSLGGNTANIAAAGTIGGETAVASAGLGNNLTSVMLQESFATLPTTNDQDRSNRQYTPQNPYPAMPPSYPAMPSALFDNPAIFEKLGTDALFFIFYYKQGTYQQYLAARELKKQSWRFHKKYMTWFQRHEEPKVTTEEYEQGTYVYFDYETGWCTRIKQDFRFDYAFLEDSLQ
jgi:CCR4-NOT transcription complex subunit 3